MKAPKIVEAVGTATSGRGNIASRMQEAMVEALKKAQAEGITDIEALRRVQLDARDKVREDIKKEEAKKAD